MTALKPRDMPKERIVHSQSRSGAWRLTRWSKRFALSVVTILAVAVVGCAQESASTPLHLLDMMGRRVDPLRATDAKATVFLFTRTDCPISNRYAPEVRRLYDKFAPSGVAFWLVYPDPDESVKTIRRHIKEYDYHLGVLRDPQHGLVRMTGVRFTPEVAVFLTPGSGRRLVYRGRIDDRYVDFGKMRPAPTTHDLERVLEAILEGKPLKSRTAPAVGCFISDLR